MLHSSNGFGEEDGQSVEELSLKDFDPRGEYTEVVERVKRAGSDAVDEKRGGVMEGRGDAAEKGGKRGNLEAGEGQSGGVKVFRAVVGRTRVEYYVVTVGERKLLGVVAKAVES